MFVMLVVMACVQRDTSMTSLTACLRFGVLHAPLNTTNAATPCVNSVHAPWCYCRQLKVLRLGWNHLGPKGGKALAEGLKFCSSGLEQLYLPWSGITDTGASHIAKVGCLLPTDGSSPCRVPVCA